METTTTTAVKTLWKLDPAHTEVHFRVKHLVVSNVIGSFGEFEGKVTTEADNFQNSIVEFSANVASINTNNPQRDAHLKSADFFDAENYPKLTFVSKKIIKKSDNTYELVGDITIRGIKKEISLDVETGGTTTDAYGNTVAGFEITGKLNRKEFGLRWDNRTETGGIIVSDEVKILINAELIKQK